MEGVFAERKVILPHNDEATCLRQISSCPGGWMSSRLRICPLCLEHGYHSFWYQLYDLKVCPVHGCLLTERCQCCGKPLPEYRFGRMLFEHPYRCPNCLGPISGVVPELSLFREFWAHNEELRGNYESLQRWANEITGRQCRGICHTVPTLQDCLWAKHTEIRRAPGRVCHPLPGCLPSSLDFALEVLTWRIQMVGTPRFQSPTRIVTDFRCVNSVWKAFVRRVCYWLYGVPPGSEPEEDNSRFEQQYPNMKLSEWDFRRLAFCLFLAHCKTFPPRFYDNRWWIEGLGDLPPVPMILWNKRMSRTGLMRSLLATLAGLIYTIKALVRNKMVLDVRELLYMQTRWMAVHVECDDQGLCEGAAVFPKIERYPVQWSASIKISYAQPKIKEG